MIRITAAGAVETAAGDAALPDGTGRQGTVSASYRHLVATFGNPNCPWDTGYKTHWEWWIATPDGVAALYDYEGGDDPARTPDTSVTWHIGGENPRVAAWVRMVVGDTTLATGAGEVVRHLAECTDAKAALVMHTGSADDVIAEMVEQGWTLEERVDRVAGKRIRFLRAPGEDRDT